MSRWSKSFRLLMIVVVTVITGVPVFSQEVETRSPLEPSDTSSPKATLNSFFAACQEFYELADNVEGTEDPTAKLLPAAERIRDCLDLSGLPADLRDQVGGEAAVYLKEVLDRTPMPAGVEPPSASSPDLKIWRIPGTRITIKRVDDGNETGAYLFSTESVRNANKFYSMAKDLPYVANRTTVTKDFLQHYKEVTRRQSTLSADTSSPRGTLTLFLESTNEIFEAIRSEKYVERGDANFNPTVLKVYSCLDLTNAPDYAREQYANEAAVCLKEILDRIPLPAPEDIPGPENLNREAGAALLRWQIPNTEIVIAKVTEGPQRNEYLFTPGTLERVIQIYGKMKHVPYRTEGQPVSPGFYEWYLSAPGNAFLGTILDSLPNWFRNRIWSLAIWQWIGLIGAAIFSLAAMLAAYWLGAMCRVEVPAQNLWRYWGSLVFPTVAMLIPLGFNHVLEKHISIRGQALYTASFIASAIFLLALIVVVLGLSGRLANSVIALPRSKTRGLDPHLIRILFRAMGIVAAAVVFLEGGQFLGLPLTTLLASAGIGGLAIALSAQGTIKSLFGTVTILFDKPYRVGERIVVDGNDGIVEEIGLRSTKIREFLTNHLISIPNDRMAESEIKNIGKRRNIHRQCDLHIPLDTPRENIEKALEVIRKALANHEEMDPDYPPRAYFNDFNVDSFNIRIMYWFAPPELWSYYEFSEKINLAIFQAFEKYGIQFSLPLRHTYWKHDGQQGPLDINILDGRQSK